MVAGPIALLNVVRSEPFRLGKAAWRISLPGQICVFLLGISAANKRHVQLFHLNLGGSLGVQQKEGGCRKRRASLKRRGWPG